MCQTRCKVEGVGERCAFSSMYEFCLLSWDYITVTMCKLWCLRFIEEAWGHFSCWHWSEMLAGKQERKAFLRMFEERVCLSEWEEKNNRKNTRPHSALLRTELQLVYEHKVCSAVEVYGMWETGPSELASHVVRCQVTKYGKCKCLSSTSVFCQILLNKYFFTGPCNTYACECC